MSELGALAPTPDSKVDDAYVVSETTYAAIAAANIVGVVLWQDGGRILDANEKFLELLALDPATIRRGTAHWRTLTPPEYHSVDATRVAELRATGSHSPYQKELMRSDGTRVPVLVASSYIDESRERGVAVVVDQTAAREADVERKRTESLQRLSAALTRVLTRADVTQVVLTHLVSALGAATGGVIELAPRGDEMLLLGTVGYDAAATFRFARMSLDAPMPARDVVRTHQSVFIESRDEWAARFGEEPPVTASDASRAWAAIPLLVEDRLLGVMVLGLDGPRAIPDDERRFMRTFADLCAQALERARLYEAEQAARALAERLQRITAALAAAATVDAIAETLIEQTIVAMRADTAIFCLRDSPPADDWVTIVRARGLPSDVAAEFSRFPLDSPGAIGTAMRTSEPIFVERRDGPDGLLERFGVLANMWTRLGTQALASIPLKASNAIAGSLLLMFSAPRALGDDDRSFLISTGQQTGLALERNRLLDSERAARGDAESARASAVQANQAKSQFLATMSHELRTPLNAIGGYVDLMLMGIRGPLSAQQQEDLTRVQRSQLHLLSLINEVLDYARLDAGSVRYEIADVGLASLLTGLESLVMPQLRAKQLTLEVEAPPRGLQARADVEKLRRILLNLLSNAIKFTTAEGRVSVRAELMDGNRLAIVVEDTGVGIAPDNLETVFEPFVQVGRALHMPVEGSGLGLAISRDLARGMGGDLTLESTLGVGSRFRVVLRRPAGQR